MFSDNLLLFKFTLMKRNETHHESLHQMTRNSITINKCKLFINRSIIIIYLMVFVGGCKLLQSRE